MSPAQALENVIEFPAERIGDCPRAVAADFLGHEPETPGRPSHSDLAESGVERALEIVGRDLLRRLGWRVIEPDEASGLITQVEAEGFVIKGDLSGLARQGPTLAGVVIKPLSDGRFRRVTAEGPGAEKGLVDQLQVTMAGRDLPKNLLVALRRSEPVFALALALRGGAEMGDWTYQSALDHLIRSQAVEVIEVDRDPVRLQKILAEWASLATAIRSGRMPDAEPGQACAACAHRRFCAGEVAFDQVGTATLTAADLPDLDGLVESYVQAKASADRAASALKDKTEQLKRLLVDRGARRAVSRAGAVTLIKNQGRRSLNPELIPAPIYQAALVRGRPFVTLRFTPVRGSTDGPAPVPACSEGSVPRIEPR
jgi:hypothetical protein